MAGEQNRAPLSLEVQRLRMDQIVRNRARRLLLCLCVDASASMSLDGRISAVNREIDAFLQNMERTATTRDAVEVCVVTFGDEVEVRCEFGPLSEARRANRAIRASGSRSELGAGVLLALDQLRRRQDLLTEMGISCYRPWLILISDGAATDIQRCQEAGGQVKDLLRQDRLRVKCLSLSQEPEHMRALREFTPSGQVDQVDSLEMTEFFGMLSRSVSRASRQSIQRGELALYDSRR